MAVFIDSDRNGSPGTLQRSELTPGENGSNGSGHPGPREPLNLARELHGSSPEAVHFTINGENFDQGEGLSDSVQTCMESMMKQLAGLIREFV